MNLSTIKLQIIKHFFNKQYFNIEEHIDKIEIPSSLKDSSKDIVLLALKSLEDDGFIKGVKENDTNLVKVWIMINDISTHGQNVYITLPLCNLIADTINAFIQVNELNEEPINPLAISERAVAILVSIINDLLETDNDEKEDEENS